mgnify:CR=1 FL=1
MDSMKADKATRILMLYRQLLCGQSVDKVTYSLEYGINERTFSRDIETIRVFLGEIYSENQLLFDRDSNTYYLTGKRPRYMNRMDATILIKILLESGLLRKDEMEGLIDVVLSSVQQYDAEVIKDYLSYDIKSYTSETSNAVLKFVGDLYGVLKAGYDIELIYSKEEGYIETMKVSPLQIICKEHGFYLIAAFEFNLEKIEEISVDLIVRFKILQTTFAKELKKTYRMMEGI